MKKYLFIIPILFLTFTSIASAITYKAQVGFGSFKTEVTIDGNSIGRYIQEVYNYAVGAVGILATITMMWGGVRWLTAGGNKEAVADAQSWIKGSLTGLVLIMTSYLILYTINPDLIFFKTISLSTILKTQPLIVGEESMVGAKKLKWQQNIQLQYNDADASLQSALSCMRQDLNKNCGVNCGIISSISDSNHIGNLSACTGTSCSNCAHSCNSCHYGRGVSSKSLAVDYGDENNYDKIKNSALACGISDSKILLEGNHVHISLNSCPN